jgi:hypothetical protein
MKRIGNVNIDVFDDVVLHDLHPDGPLIENRKSSPHRRSNEEPMTAEDTRELRMELINTATSWISPRLGEHAFFCVEDIFGMEEIDSIIGKIAKLEVEEDLRVVVGGHHFTGPGSDGLVSQLLPVIQKFKTGVIYLAYQARLNSILEDKYVKKTAFKHLNETQKSRKRELKKIEDENKMKKQRLTQSTTP